MTETSLRCTRPAPKEGLTATLALLVDGAVIATDASAPYAFSWSTAGAQLGDHTLQLMATDGCGNIGFSSQLGVTVVAAVPDIAVAQAFSGTPMPSGASVDLGTTGTGEPISLRFRIDNQGGAPLNLDAPADLVSGACFHQIETPASPVAAGGAAFFRVRLLCTAAGDHSGSVSIDSDDPDESPYGLTVTGTVTAAAAPQAAVFRAYDGAPVPAGTSVDLGSTTAGQATSLRFRIDNQGDAPLTLAAPANLVTGGCFSQIETPASLIAVGGSAFFRVRLLCATAGEHSGSVMIASEDPASPYSFAVTGTVTP